MISKERLEELITYKKSVYFAKCTNFGVGVGVIELNSSYSTDGFYLYYKNVAYPLGGLLYPLGRLFETK